MTSYGELLAARRGVDYVRHAWLTFGGTWSVPGTGYCSWVIGAADEDLVFEVPVAGPYTFGPVGGALNAPGYRQSVAICKRNAIDWIRGHPRQTFGMGGYSMGAQAASEVYMELAPGGELEDRADDFIGGFTLGNPSRQERKGIGPGATVPDGQGISPVRMTSTPTTWVDYVNEFAGVPDIYARTPVGPVGKVMEAAYDFGIDLQLNNGIEFITDLVQNILALLDSAGIDLPVPSFGSIISGAFLGLLASFIPQLRGRGDNETAAAVQAAILALRFIASNPPTAPHIRYEFDFVTPGVTFLEHARRHVNARCSAVPARVAA